MRKIVKFLVSVFVIAASVHSADARDYRVGLVYMISHPAIDQGIEGYKDQLESEFSGDDSRVVTTYYNANGEIKNLNQIIQMCIDRDFDAVVALTTPAAQVAKRLLSQKPLIFVGVSDPISAGLVDSLERGKENVTGTTSKDPVSETMELFVKVFPNINSIGIIYSSSEDNSVSILRSLEERVEKNGIPVRIKKKSINSTSEIHSAATALSDEVDAFFLINDNSVVSALKVILRVAKQSGKPVFASDVESVRNGALLTLGLDYGDEGKASVSILKSVLVDKVSPDKIPIYVNKKYYLYVNKRIYEEFPNIERKWLENAVVVE